MRSAQARTEDNSDSHHGVTQDDPAVNAGTIRVEDVRTDSTRLPAKIAADINKWLDWQSRMIHGVQSSAVYLRKDNDTTLLRLAAHWSSTNTSLDPETDPLAEVALQSFRTESQVTKKVSGANKVMQEHSAFPLTVQGKVFATVALAMSVRSNEQRNAVIQLHQWCAVWLEKLLEQINNGRPDRQTLELESLLTLSRDVPLPVALHSLSTLLAERLSCSSVTVGLCRGLQVLTVAASHQLDYERRTERIRELENAMEECVDQRMVVCLPNKNKDNSLEPAAHIQMMTRQAIVSVCSVPLFAADQIIGVITCTRDRGEALDASFSRELGGIAVNLAPLILKQQRLEKPFGSFRKANTSSPDPDGSKSRPLYRAILIGLLATALIAALFIQVDHRISASSVVEGTFQQAITVPFAGQLSAVHARAGDKVEALQVLAELDDSDLILEREKWLVEHSRHNKEYQLALASRDRAQVGMSAARLAQSEAELQLLESRLAQTSLVAPFSGLLVTGDWSQSLGAPVETGQLMFEIVPLEGYRLILEVDEHDIAHIARGQHGRVRLAGLPSQPIDMTIQDVLPIANPHDGANYFRVEADVLNAPAAVRPGMQGVAKITVGRTNAAKAWFGSLFERLRLTFWLFGS